MSTSVLFDAPGPKARRLYAALAVLGVLVALVGLWLVLRKMGDAGQLEKDLWTPFLTAEVWQEYLLPGIWGTLKAAAISMVLAGIFGLVFGMGRLSHLSAVRWVSSIVVEFFRSVPVLIMMIFSFGVYVDYNVFATEVNPLAAVVTGLTLYNGSVVAELVRSGVYSLPAGQAEAARAIGLTFGQTMSQVILPQAFRGAIAPLGSTLIALIKNTTVAAIIGNQEAAGQMSEIVENEGSSIGIFLIFALGFVILTLPLGLLFTSMSRRLAVKR